MVADTCPIHPSQIGVVAKRTREEAADCVGVLKRGSRGESFRDRTGQSGRGPTSTLIHPETLLTASVVRASTGVSGGLPPMASLMVTVRVHDDGCGQDR